MPLLIKISEAKLVFSKPKLRNPEKSTSGLGTILNHTHAKSIQQIFIGSLLRARHCSSAGTLQITTQNLCHQRVDIPVEEERQQNKKYMCSMLADEKCNGVFKE